MEYTVLIERKQEGWRAFIPALADLGAEGVSRDAAVRNVQRAAEAYLSAVEVTTIKVNLLQELSRRLGSPRTLLRALEAFAGDAEALREHLRTLPENGSDNVQKRSGRTWNDPVRAGYRHRGFCFPTASHSAATPAAFT